MFSQDLTYIELLQFVNTIAVLLSAISALLMLSIAFTNKNIAKKNAEIQERLLSLQQGYNIDALCPKCDIVCSEAGGIMKISLYNYGHGTMTINHLDIVNKETGSALHNAYEIIPDSIGLSYYSLEAKGRNIRVGGHIKLIEIDRNRLSVEEYKKVRKTLAQYTITVYYKGLYDDETEMSATKDLAKLFGNVYREFRTVSYDSCLTTKENIRKAKVNRFFKE